MPRNRIAGLLKDWHEVGIAAPTIAPAAVVRPLPSRRPAVRARKTQTSPATLVVVGAIVGFAAAFLLGSVLGAVA